ncbi:MAG: hypothetical protein ABI435_02790 [Pseudolysinimonas sp.]
MNKITKTIATLATIAALVALPVAGASAAPAATAGGCYAKVYKPVVWADPFEQTLNGYVTGADVWFNCTRGGTITVVTQIREVDGTAYQLMDTNSITGTIQAGRWYHLAPATYCQALDGRGVETIVVAAKVNGAWATSEPRNAQC